MKKIVLVIFSGIFMTIFQIQTSFAQQNRKNLTKQQISAANPLTPLNRELTTATPDPEQSGEQLAKQYIATEEQKTLQRLNLNKPKTNPHVACNEQDSLALVALFRATNGVSWSNNTNWLATPVYQWYGVTIDSSGYVTGLDLHYNYLSGQLPDEIGNLTHLIFLKLNANSNLYGNIPGQIGNLSNLQILWLQQDNLSGNIPPEIGNLTNLTALALSDNDLSGTIPEQIGNLQNLQILDLGHNHLTGTIPSQIGNLTNLTALSLENNQLTGTIPSQIGNLTNLTSLDLAYNQLTGNIPAEIGNLTKLYILLLNSNQLTGNIPDQIGQLDSLVFCLLNRNQLSGPIPDEIGNLTMLEYLYLSDNNLTGNIPQSIGNLTDLKTLLLQNNNLSGNIPESIGNLSNLEYLRLNDNKLTGPIPGSIGNLTNLTHLNLSNNLLSGNIPGTLGNMTNLEYLYLSHNMLSGQIPDSLGYLSNLRHLYLSYNKLTGQIPASLGNLSNLRYLYLDHNLLTDTIPSQLGNMNSLSVLNLNYNKLTGNIPVALTNLTNLRGLSLGHNQLTGTIPAEIASMPNLWVFDVSYNHFSDNLANFYATYSPLARLNVEHNNLDFADLDTFHAQEDMIRDFYYSPQAKVGLSVEFTSSSTIKLGVAVGGQNNHYQWFNDSIAIDGATDSILNINRSDTGMFYCEITNPKYPDLTLYSIAYENGVTLLDHGIYKQEYNALKALYDSTAGNNWYYNSNWLSDADVYDWYGLNVIGFHVIDINLDNNNLNGTIPPAIDSLSYLKTLDLSFNNLAGNIPPQIGNLDSLQTLKLNNNQLTGNIPTELCSLDSLKFLYLDSNQLSGPIPSEIGNLSKLMDLHLNANQFSGNIPATLNNLSNLIYLHLENNQLCGAEGELSSPPYLYFVFLGNNKLQFGALDTLYIDWSTILAGSYAPQDSVPIYSNIDLPNSQVQLNVLVSGLHNHYQWFYNDTAIDGATSPNLTFDFHERPEGYYYCQITNPDYPLLTLTSHKYKYTTLNQVKFIVTDGSNPLQGAWVVLGDDSLQTDVNGQALFGLANGVYAYRVHKNGYSPVADTFTVENIDQTINVTLTYTGIAGINNTLKIYPNPVHYRLHIVGITAPSAKAQIFDLQGHKLFDQVFVGTHQTIDMTHFSSGLYILKIVTHNGTKVYKITKQ